MLSGPIQVAGVRGHCSVEGNGSPILLLHGWGAEGASLQPIATHLAARCRTITPDLPGFGASPPPPADWGVPEYAAWVAGLLERLGVGSATVLGHSFGGRLGIWLAAERPALVERLILIDAAGLRPPPSARRQAAVGVSKLGRAATALPLAGGLAGRLRARWHRAVGATDYAAAGPLRGTFVKVIAQDLRACLPRIGAPTLLLWGAEDRDTPLSDGQTMAELIPHARLVVFAGAGHYSYLERTTETLAAIDEFLGAPKETA